MISVKGAKVDPSVADPAEVYRLKDDRRESRTPFLAGGILAAIAVYLKTALDSAARAVAGSADPARAAPEEGQAVVNELASLATESPAGETWQGEAKSSAAEAFRFATPTPVVFESNFVRPIPPPANGSALAALKSSEAVPEETPPADIPQATSQDDPQDKGGLAESVPEMISNAAPDAIRMVFLDNVASGGSLQITFADLLAYVRDVDGDRLSVQDATVSSGSLVRTSTGYLFRADDDALGPVQIVFQVSDGEVAIELVAQLSTVPNSFAGGLGDDEIAGSMWRDEIVGDRGNDKIKGLGGSDFLDGGEGRDTIIGGAGQDALYGGDDDDLLYGGEGNDVLSGGQNDDVLFGEDGADILYGGAGADVLADGLGADILFGGQGADTIAATSDGEADVFDGGEDRDTLDYSAAEASLRIDLLAGKAQGAEIGEDHFTGFEIIRAGAGDDHFVVGIKGVTLAGGGGANVFEFAEVALGQAEGKSMYEIIDFGVGDVVRSTKYDIYSRPDNDDDDDDLYQAMHSEEDAATDTGKIRFRHEILSDDQEKTIVEWDNDDLSHLTVITIDGRHVMVWTENGA